MGERICRQVIKPGRKGVRPEEFQSLKTAVGIAREEARNAKKRTERIEREKKDAEEAKRKKALFDEKMSKLREPLDALLKELDKLGVNVSSAESSAQELTSAAGT